MTCPTGYSQQTIQGITSCFRQGPAPAKDNVSPGAPPSIYVDDNWAFCGKTSNGWQSGSISSGGCHDTFVIQEPNKTYSCTSDGSLKPLVWCPSNEIGRPGSACQDRVANFVHDTDEQPWCNSSSPIIQRSVDASKKK